MAEKGSGDKTEKPTPKRRKQAKDEGQLPKSKEVGSWLQVLIATFVVQMTFNASVDLLNDLTIDIRRIARDPDPELALAIFGNALGRSVLAILPIALLMTLVGVLATAAQIGLVFTPKALKPKLSKINPLQGLKRLVKPQGLWQGAKSLLKLVLIGGVAWGPVFGIAETIAASSGASMFDLAKIVGSVSLTLVRTISWVGLALAAGDYAFTKWQNTKQLKMSKQEVKDEHKQSEGDPKMKGQIRSRMYEMNRNRMIAAVPDANVVIVNPTHIAVALRYKAGEGAPTVVAKGRGHIALRIREQAEKHSVPIVRDVVLARTLERSTKVDQPIPLELYEAVAHVLAFVMRVGQRARLMGGGVMDNPRAEPIPDDMLDQLREEDLLGV